jgi:hypothetical protein
MGITLLGGFAFFALVRAMTGGFSQEQRDHAMSPASD